MSLGTGNLAPAYQARPYNLTRAQSSENGLPASSSASPSAPSLSSADERSRPIPDVERPYTYDGELTPPSTVINIPSSTTATSMAPGESGSTSTHNGFARSRRKSVSQHIGSMPADSSDEVDPYPLMSGGQPFSTKMKRKKSRASSFSLPFHRRRRLSNGGLLKLLDRQSRRAARLATPRQSYCLLITFGLFVLLINWWRWSYELQLELSVFSRRWTKSEIDTLQPLKGCFDPSHISPHYNLTKHLAPKYIDPSPGIAMRRGMTCFDYSATIGASSQQPLEHLTYHTYWRSDLIPFGDRQTATLVAFLATQPLSHSKLILWSNGAGNLRENENVKQIMNEWSDFIEIRQADMAVLTKGTELAGILSGAYGGGMYDQKGWVDGDAVRLLVLWHYGGVWMDMDEVLTRDIHPLTESEFVTQWDCYDKEYFSLNGAIMHFERHSPYLCEAFHIMASSPLPEPNTFSWGSFLYSKLHRRLLASHVKPFAVLPWCFADPRNCRDDISFPDPFKPDPKYWEGRRWDGRGEVGKSGSEMLDQRLSEVWTVHLHNQWNKRFPEGGWMDRLFALYAKRLEEISQGRRAVGSL